MYNTSTPLQNFWQNTTTTQKITLLLIPFFTIFIIILSIIIISNQPIQYDSELLANAKHITIDNFNELAPNMPEFYKLETRSNIWIILQNYNNVPTNTYTSSTIRNETYKVEYNTGDNINTSSFIVDIPSLEQSFHISFSWISNTKIPEEWLVNISCPNYQDVIYQNTLCKTSDSQLNNLYEYLPTSIDNIRLSIQKYNQYGLHPNERYLSVDYETCDKSALYYNNIKDTVYTWLKKHYIDPDSFLIEYNPHCSNIQLIEGEPYEN